jgi:ABC-type nitrate/sulfonate/bicarbonate transport system substrate-binding protein
MIEDDPDVVRRMVRATLRSLRYVQEHEDETVSMAVRLLDVDEEMAREAYEVFRHDWGYRPRASDVEDLFRIQNEFLDDPVEYDVAQWLDYSFLNDVLEELGEEPLEHAEMSAFDGRVSVTALGTGSYLGLPRRWHST